MRIKLSFPQLADEMIPYIRIVPIFRTTDDYVDFFDDYTFLWDFRYFWEKVESDSNTWIYYCHVTISGFFGIPGDGYNSEEALPLEFKLKVFSVNDERRDELLYSKR